VLPLRGYIPLGAGKHGQPQPQLHAVLGLADGTTRWAPLLEGRVWPTLEVIIRQASADLGRTGSVSGHPILLAGGHEEDSMEITKR
jgi:predicted DNA-binding protein with PD1-like motif